MTWMWMSLIWSWVVCARGKPEEARAIIDHALSVWGRGGKLAHYWRLFNDVNYALYEGDGARAREYLAHNPYGGVLRHLLGGDGTVQHHWAHARAAIAEAIQQPVRARSLAVEAERHARGMDREAVRWGAAVAPSILAAVCLIRGHKDEAIAHLEKCEALAREVDMEMIVAAAQRARAAVVGGAVGARLLAESDAWMASQRVADPAKFAAIYLPGPWA